MVEDVPAIGGASPRSTVFERVTAAVQWHPVCCLGTQMLTAGVPLLYCAYAKRSGHALLVLAAVLLAAGGAFAQDTPAQPADASSPRPASSAQATSTIS